MREVGTMVCTTSEAIARMRALSDKWVKRGVLEDTGHVYMVDPEDASIYLLSTPGKEYRRDWEEYAALADELAARGAPVLVTDAPDSVEIYEVEGHYIVYNYMDMENYISVEAELPEEVIRAVVGEWATEIARLIGYVPAYYAPASPDGEVVAEWEEIAVLYRRSEEPTYTIYHDTAMGGESYEGIHTYRDALLVARWIAEHVGRMDVVEDINKTLKEVG